MGNQDGRLSAHAWLNSERGLSSDDKTQKITQAMRLNEKAEYSLNVSLEGSKTWCTIKTKSCSASFITPWVRETAGAQIESVFRMVWK